MLQWFRRGKIHRPKTQFLERIMRKYSNNISDDVLRKTYCNCFLDTISNATFYIIYEGKVYTYIITGDIPAMWIRDSVNQIKPYLRFVSENEELDNIVAGLIREISEFFVLDPYANAFLDYKKGFTKIKRNLNWPKGKEWKEGVWERKWELDSPGAFFNLSFQYYKITNNIDPFDETWIEGVTRAIEVIEREMSGLNWRNYKGLCRFIDPKGNPHPAVRILGYNYPGKKCGLVRTLFRPSDDEALLPYNIPSNALVSIGLKGISEILKVIGEYNLSRKAKDLGIIIESAIYKHSVFKVDGKAIFAYEIDGYGSYYFMDDPNISSLLSLPYIGFCDIQNKLYENTRKRIFSENNPFYVEGKKISGLASPHTGFKNVWPMATIVRAMTSEDEEEIKRCLQDLKLIAERNEYRMCESIDPDNLENITRRWFCWCNSLFSEMIMELIDREILQI